MYSPRLSKRSSFNGGSQTLVTDSVILSEDEITRAQIGDGEETCRGDVIDGLRNGLILSAGFWALLIVLGLFIFR
jgi:hypothetical protein